MSPQSFDTPAVLRHIVVLIYPAAYCSLKGTYSAHRGLKLKALLGLVAAAWPEFHVT